MIARVVRRLKGPQTFREHMVRAAETVGVVWMAALVAGLALPHLPMIARFENVSLF